MRLVDISERFIIYVTEQSFFISLTSLIAMTLNLKAVFLGFFIAYKNRFYYGIFPYFCILIQVYII
jgi:hypothetical protein